jgi:pilus assembly protein Flp/PilA
MGILCRRIVDFLNNDEGPTAVEYAVMLALIIVVCVMSIRIVGNRSLHAFGTTAMSIGATVTGGT